MDASRWKALLLPLGGALLLSGAAGAVYYYLTRNDDDESEVWQDKSSSYAMSVKVEVPVEAVGFVIGRQGSNVKLIEISTNTRIRFSEYEENGKRMCVIVGSPENISLARRLIMKTIIEQPVIEISEMKVPHMAVPLIIGQNGSMIRSISLSTGVKITVEKEEFSSSPTSPEEMKRIILKGTKEQIESAKIQLLEKVVEAEEYRQQIGESANNMSLRFRGRQGTQEHETSQSSMNSYQIVHQEALSFSNSDKFIEAYVSAVNSATHFWLQVVSPRAIQLDKLVTEMTEYYSDKENRELHQLDKVTVDSIVAAKFPHDDSWYRGRVCNFEPNEQYPEQSQVTVCYVDFGDTETIKMDSVWELRTDFLKLSFQAIECFLANIDPESAQSEEAADMFEELTYASQWKVVMVKVVGYKQQGSTTIPCVQIIDVSGPTDVDVAAELVKKGLATFSKDTLQL